MKKIITSLLSSFAVVTSATPLIANQITSQEIESMKTKVDFWIEKTKNWENYVAKEFRYEHYNTSNNWHFYSKNMLEPNYPFNSHNVVRIEYLDNYTINPYQPINERKWFDYDLTYYPHQAIDLKCNVRSWSHGNFIKEFEMNDYPLVKPENADLLYPTSEYNKIGIKPSLRNGELGVYICFYYPRVELLDPYNEQEIFDKEQYYPITYNHSSSDKINIKITGTIIYRIRESVIQKLQNKLLSIKEQLNNPDLAKDAYRSNLFFMNLEN